ncbi:MAG: YceI family protein [Acidimicrobiales bacterium]
MTQVRVVRAGDYEVDERNTRIGFAARYAMVTVVRGEFSAFTGRAHLDPEVPARSWATVTISAASLTTSQAQRDEHLRSPDFLDVDSYPDVLFHSTEVVALDPGHFSVSGDLTVCGVTRSVPVDFRLVGMSVDPTGHELVGFAGNAAISRADFGLIWNNALETGGVLVGDEVGLQFDVSLILVTDQALASAGVLSGHR